MKRDRSDGDAERSGVEEYRSYKREHLFVFGGAIDIVSIDIKASNQTFLP